MFPIRDHNPSEKTPFVTLALIALNVAVFALMWLGRGEFDAAEWEEAVEEARNSWTTATAEYLIAHPQLADHLLEGLDLLGYSCEA